MSGRQQDTARRRATERRRRGRWLAWLLGGATALAAGVVALAMSSSQPGSSARAQASLSVTPNVTAGLQTTLAPWPAEYAFLAQRLVNLSLPAESDAAYQIHTFLAVFVNGEQVTIPTGVGSDPQLRFLSPIHTHDSSGIIHIEASRPYPFTLGQLFAVWGVKFSDSQIGAYRDARARRLTVYANGQLVDDPVHYVMRGHDSIVVGFGTPGSFPHRIRVVFPANL